MLSHRQRVCYHIIRDYDITCPELLMFPDVRTMAGLDIFTIRGTTVAGKEPTKLGPG